MENVYILGDWGTSSARFYLYENDHQLECITGPGIKFTKDPESKYAELIRPWFKKYGPLSAVIGGMVGSNIGWKEAGYVDCPAGFSDLVGGATSFSTKWGTIHIVPGVITRRSFSDNPDMMRGEEVQVFGWAVQHGYDATLCLPGTHSKWVHFQENKIANFASSLNGELFQVLSDHSILLGRSELPTARIGDEFREGVCMGASETGLNQLLFSTRSRQIAGEYDAKQAKSYLLGLLIGADVKDGLVISNHEKILIIGGEGPAMFYHEAIRVLGGKSEIYDGQEASKSGLAACHKAICIK